MKKYLKFAVAAFFVLAFLVVSYLIKVPNLEYVAPAAVNESEEIKISHLKTPESVRGIYMTSWVASDKKWRQGLVDLIDATELNAVVVDVKDYTGEISIEKRIPDIKDFIAELHAKNIYAIARIAVFQDPLLVKKNPGLAAQKKDGTGVWKDRKGLPWLDPCSQEVWDYIVKIGKDSEKVGFDELNFDYIRFASDGDMKNINYTHCPEKFIMSDVIKDFSSYLKENLQSTGVPLSIDVFGFVTTHSDDLNIGQILEKIEPSFDYICPMVYPSHYPKTFDGYKNPADHPYEIISEAMASSTVRLLAASSTPSKIRPWLQDFDLGATYDASMVRKEKQAVYDSGLNSWLLWDPANKYTRGALDSVQ
ncbi:MAG: hypothetical protein NTX55_02165 [Candidatus Parcubacteria bacterium]|nr:hypothetical protein [Candidatus Parcubacteria bacterium]